MNPLPPPLVASPNSTCSGASESHTRAKTDSPARSPLPPVLSAKNALAVFRKVVAENVGPSPPDPPVVGIPPESLPPMIATMTRSPS